MASEHDRTTDQRFWYILIGLGLGMGITGLLHGYRFNQTEAIWLGLLEFALCIVAYRLARRDARGEIA